MDADSSVCISELEKFLPALLEKNSEKKILVGSRYLDSKSIVVKQPWYRCWVSRVGNLLIRLFLLPGVKDTQCGFKIYPSSIAKKIGKCQRLNGF